jgi:hypothetical protein
MAGGAGSGGGQIVVVVTEVVVEETIIPARCEGRLTVQSGVPIPSDPAVSGVTLYFTPYKGNHISLVSAGVWKDYTFPEISIGTTGLVHDGVYDVFACDDGAGNVKLEFSQNWQVDDPTPPSPPWASRGRSTRTDAITTKDGIPVKASDNTRRLIGTVNPNDAFLEGTLLFIDSVNARYVSNLYNAVDRPFTTCVPYADDDALTTFTVTSGGTWQVPLFSLIPNYANWVLCEPRQVRISAKVSLKNSAATSYGAGLGINAGDSNYDITKMLVSTLTSDPSLQDEITWAYTCAIGQWEAWIAFVATGGDGKCIVNVDNLRNGSSHDPLLTYIHGFIAA